MMIRFLFMATLVAFAFGAHAQQPDSTTAYFSAEGKKLSGSQGAAYYAVTTMRDSVIGIVREYYPGGARRAYKFYANVRRHKRDGPQLEWYPGGQVKSVTQYLLGERNGLMETYYPDGQLRRRDVYRYGKLVKGLTYGPDGKETKYEPLEMMPEYPGGMSALAADISANTRYPKAARKDKAAGMVLVKLAVDEQGKVDPASLVVTKPVHPLLDEAALEAVSSLKTFTAGRYDGEPVRIWFAIPVSFKLD